MIFRTSKASGAFSPHRVQCGQGFDRFWYFHLFIFWSPTYIETSIFDSFLAFRMRMNGLSSLYEVKVRCIRPKFSIFSTEWMLHLELFFHNLPSTLPQQSVLFQYPTGLEIFLIYNPCTLRFRKTGKIYIHHTALGYYYLQSVLSEVSF